MGNLLYNYYEAASMVLFIIGFLMLFLHQNLVKKIIGFNIMDSSIFLFFAAKGFVIGRAAPIIQDGLTDPEYYINPIPTGLVLTGIVVSVSLTAFSLALVQKIYKEYGTIRADELALLIAQQRHDTLQHKEDSL